MVMAAALAAAGGEAPKPASSTAPAAAAAVTAPVKPEEPKKVCVTEAQLGSHFKKKICATPEEWERRRLRDAAEMSKMSDRAAAN
jgi:hypothetical protein